MVDTDLFTAYITAKRTFSAHLLAAEGAGMRLRLTDMLVATRTSDKTIETDLLLAEITRDKMDIAHEFAAFFASSPAMTAKMFSTFQTPQGVFETEAFSAKMTLYAAFLTDIGSTVSATRDPTICTDIRSAAAACMHTGMADGMKASVAHSDRFHGLIARWARRKQHFA
jgi:hypothetical protein